MVSEALITHMLSTWSGYGVYGVYGVFGPNLSLLQYVVDLVQEVFLSFFLPGPETF